MKNDSFQRPNGLDIMNICHGHWAGKILVGTNSRPTVESVVHVVFHSCSISRWNSVSV